MSKISTSIDKNDEAIHQHRKPICNDAGHCIGYSDWKDGKGLPWWPHRVLGVAADVK